MQDKKWVLLVLLCVLPFATADDLYMHDSLDLEVKVEGKWELTSQSDPQRATSVNAELFLVPRADFRQEIMSLKTQGQSKDNGLHFSWTKPVPESSTFGYFASVHTKNTYLPVSRAIAFPLASLQIVGLEEYLQPTATIDSQHPEIVQKASELTQSHTDLFKATFAMASWVEENVKYDLDSLTAQASQKASWVLEERRGVCDEMTSLFIAMARSQGIPARFVSGVSYTTSDLFSEPWQAHGWAEVYFPTVGWVPFDITFGEYGYIDVTHIRLRESVDPVTPATSYQWLGNNIDLDTNPLNFTIDIVRRGATIQEPLKLESSVLENNVEFGSYNLIKAVVRNTANSYTGTTLHLASPSEVSVLGRNRRTLLLAPSEVRETYWVVRVPQDLDSTYIYNFPFLIYTEKNMSVQGLFTSKPGSAYYSEAEISALVVQDEEKGYSQQLDLTCEMPASLSVGESATTRCTLTNNGDTDLTAVEFCVEKTCKIQELKSLEKVFLDINLQTSRAGFSHVILSAQNSLVEKRVRFPFLVSDHPMINASLVVPESIARNQVFPISVELEKESFAIPHNVQVVLTGTGFEHVWTLDQLPGSESFVLELSNPPVSFTNEYTVQVEWSDESGAPFSTQAHAEAVGKVETWSDRVFFFFNAILGLFS